MLTKTGYYTILYLILYGMSVMLLARATMDVVEVTRLQSKLHEVDCTALYLAIGSDTDADSFERACPDYFGEDEGRLTYLGDDYE